MFLVSPCIMVLAGWFHSCFEQPSHQNCLSWDFPLWLYLKWLAPPPGQQPLELFHNKFHYLCAVQLQEAWEALKSPIKGVKLIQPYDCSIVTRDSLWALAVLILGRIWEEGVYGSRRGAGAVLFVPGFAWVSWAGVPHLHGQHHPPQVFPQEPTSPP